MEIRIKTSVATEPLTAAVSQTYLKYIGSADTAEIALIASMVKAARELCESEANRSFARQTLVVTIDKDEIYNNKFELPRGPIYTITSVKGIDVEGNETALTLNTDYYKHGTDFLEIELGAFSSTVPVGLSGYTRYKIEYVAGYTNEDPYKIPNIFILAMEKLLTEWYQNRHDFVPDMAVMTNESRRLIQSETGDIYL